MWYSKSSPEKVRVVVELLHQDGGKTILKTVDLDARHISVRNLEEEPSHMTVGMVDPYRTWEDSFFRSWQFPDRLPPNHETFFDLNIQLEKHPDADEPFVYTIQYIEKPTNQMVLSYLPDANLVNATGMTVDEAAEHIDGHRTKRIYFVVEIPS